MKTLTVLFGLLVFTNVAADINVDKTVAAAKDGDIILQVPSGEVEIKAWDKAEIHIQGEIEGKGDLLVKTEAGRTHIEIKSEKDSGWGKHRAGDAELTIMVPKNSSINAKGFSTDITINGVEGEIGLEVVSGDIALTEARNDLDLTTISGEVEVSDSQGKMRVSTVSGDVKVVGDAPQFKCTTVSGDVQAELKTSELIECSSVSGDLGFSFVLAKNGDVEAHTVSGDMLLNFANKKLNARFDIETGPGGDIKNNITDLKPESSMIGAQSLEFDSGNNGGKVSLRTMSGSVRLNN